MFEDRLKFLREERKLNMKQIAQKLNIPYTTYVGYEKNEREPNSETLIEIADFFDCSIDYLLGRSNERANSPETFEDTEKTPPLKISRSEGQSLLSELDDAEKLELLNYLGYLKYKRNGGT